MLEFVTDDPGLPQNEKDKIQYHLDQFCANCRRHHELEIELQAGRAK